MDQILIDGESSFGKRTSLEQQAQVEHGHWCAFPEVGLGCCDWLCTTVCLSVCASKQFIEGKAMMVTTSSDGSRGKYIFKELKTRSGKHC